MSGRTWYTYRLNQDIVVQKHADFILVNPCSCRNFMGGTRLLVNSCVYAKIFKWLNKKFQLHHQKGFAIFTSAPSHQ